jgi:predicted lipoprotein with Yx(FWY)xxD motif
MQQRATSRPRRRSIRIGLVTLATVLVLPAAAGIASSGQTKRVAKLEQSKQGGSVLANLKGHTLYSLSVEKHGKFICTGGCLSVWHPLTVPKGVQPTGPVKLGTVKRPDGRIQVTYHGRPLYSFAEDVKPGETNGDGFKDVGTWHPATPASSSSTQPEQPGQAYPPTEYPTTPAPPQGESPSPKPPTEQPPCQYPPYCY